MSRYNKKQRALVTGAPGQPSECFVICHLCKAVHSSIESKWIVVQLDSGERVRAKVCAACQEQAR